jgi:CarD family transcriptional regulator
MAAAVKDEFPVGSHVIYPFHGVAKIVARESREVDGESEEYLRLFVPATGSGQSSGLTLLVPEERAIEVGIRQPVSEDEADDVLDVVRQVDVTVPAGWSRRFKNHQDKLKTGDIYHCAEVVRNLEHRRAVKPLAPAESQMLMSARQTLVGELAISWSVEHDEAAERIDEALQAAS